MSNHRPRRVLMLVNPKSGVIKSFSALRRVMDRHWDVEGIDLVYQFSQSREDSIQKVRRAIAHGVDTILATGGDGTVNTVASVLIGTSVKLGVIPTGSGNGFARHFGIPLDPAEAVTALRGATEQRIDVGYADDHPFFVTCGMAWDVSIAQAFEKLPFRGVLPYVFAGATEFLRYQPQAATAVFDDGTELGIPDPLLFTVANLTQFGGGARIAPHACADDGLLELVVARRQDAPELLDNIPRLFDGTLHTLPEVILRSFRTMTVRRAKAAPIHIDGEIVEAGAEVRFRIQPAALRVLVPEEKLD